MLRLSRPIVIARAMVLAGVFACGNSDPTAANAVAVNGTMTGDLSAYGPWIGQKTVIATSENGSLKIIGEDVNFKKITILLAEVDISATQSTPRTITITTENGALTGYVEFSETYQTGIYQYNTFEAGHATIVLTHVGTDKVTGTFSFEVHRFPSGAALPAGSTAARSLTSGAFDIRPTVANP